MVRSATLTLSLSLSLYGSVCDSTELGCLLQFMVHLNTGKNWSDFCASVKVPSQNTRTFSPTSSVSGVTLTLTLTYSVCVCVAVLHFQLKEVPDDFFVDIVSRNNFLTTTLQVCASVG